MFRSLVKCVRFIPKHCRQINTTVDREEIARFCQMSNNWWDINGDFKALHTLNKLRIPLIRDGLQKLPNVPFDLPLQGLKLVDVGCGGGILSEPLSRLGAEVVGLDACAENIETAKYHASLSPSLTKERLTYLSSSVEEFLAKDDNKNAEKFDGVILSEIVEHVIDVENFLKTSCSLVKPGGSIFVTTMNKTILSYALAIVAAEKIFKIVPEGVHDWNKFISPQDLKGILEKYDFHVRLIHGMAMNPLNLEWCWCANDSINYALHAVKHSSQKM